MRPHHLVLAAAVLAILAGLFVMTYVAMQSPGWSTPARNPTHATPTPWPSR